MKEIYTAIGLMSGTSLDGVDLALIQSDGKSVIKNQKFTYHSYSKNMQDLLRNLIYKNPNPHQIKKAEYEFTLLNAKIVNQFLEENNIDKNQIDLIAFHGHTILHLPKENLTWQIGNKDLLQAKTNIKVVNNFRNFDMAYGGQGAPLVPIYHFHILQNQEKPAIVLNIGGISNITYIPNHNENDIEAFDICFGNAPIDDLVRKKLDLDFDKNGDIAKNGAIDYILVDRIMQNEIFNIKPPKSYDRDDFFEIIAPINNLKIEDALISFAYMHAKILEKNLNFLQNKQKIKSIFICGGGRKNLTIIAQIQKILPNIKIQLIDEIGFNGDAIEAEAFAFLGIRMMKNLPISFQKTTGILPEIDYAQAFFQ